MASINGTLEHADDVQPPSIHLGKRKRSESPQKSLSATYPSDFQRNLQTVLDKVKRDNFTSCLLNHSLPSNPSDRQDSKRTRLSSASDHKTSIDTKIRAGDYTSLDQLQEDLNKVKREVMDGTSINGDTKHKTAEDAASELLALITAHLDRTSDSKVSQSSPPFPQHHTGQIITLRSQTEKGTQQLYSGLQTDKDDMDSLVIDGRRLPNGFELTDPATMDSTLLAPAKEKRLFGDVFRPRSSLKQLDMPRPRPTNRTAILNFDTAPPSDKFAPVNRTDYKYQSLPTSTWLSYSKGTSSTDHDILRKQRERALTATDFRAALGANDTAGAKVDEADTLFKKVFSSFTPTYDSSKGLVNEEDHHRSYWRRYGQKRLNNIFKTDYPELDEVGTKQRDSIEENFDDVVSNFQPDDDEEIKLIKDDPQDLNEVLDEVSQLLESVHSYQSIRAASNRNTEISGDEVDTFELLRSQLSILVSTLPPFAVAKLNGDKLNDLNISTNIMVAGTDFRGTGQPDDYTLQRYRAAQQATSAATRAPQQPAARTQYPTPATAPRYASNYTQPTQPPYAPRTNTTYQQTPTAQRPYQSANTYNPQSAVAQFQRPVQNGYNYGAQTPSYSQTPSQPGYQQRAQQQALAYGRTASPTKPMVNGQAPYYNQAQNQRPQQAYSPAPQQTPAQSGLTNGT